MFCQTQKVPITTESPAAIKMYLPRLISAGLGGLGKAALLTRSVGGISPPPGWAADKARRGRGSHASAFQDWAFICVGDRGAGECLRGSEMLPARARLARRGMSLQRPVTATRRRAAWHWGAPCSWVRPARRFLLPSLQPCCWKPSPHLCPFLQGRKGGLGVPKTAAACRVIPGQGCHPLFARHSGKG